MQISDALLSFFVGIILRFGIPIIITIVLVAWLRQIDQRWQDEAKRSTLIQPALVGSKNIGCWKINNCSVEAQTKCAAYANQDIPCWQNFREENGALKEKCLACKVFRQSPIPVTV
jgi:hypothetical protein